MPFWDERFEAVAADYPDVDTAKFHVGILAAQFVLHPDWFDVVVGSNLFGDILSDLGPAIAGTIGIAPSANINGNVSCRPCSSRYTTRYAELTCSHSRGRGPRKRSPS